jgi:hypothetical protein
MKKYYCDTHLGRARRDFAFSEAAGTHIIIACEGVDTDKSVFLTPADARALAADILAAADEVDGVEAKPHATVADILAALAEQEALLKAIDEQGEAIISETRDLDERVAKLSGFRVLDNAATAGHIRNINQRIDDILPRLAALEAAQQPEAKCVCGSPFTSHLYRDNQYIVGCDNDYCNKIYYITASDPEEAKRIARRQQDDDRDPHDEAPEAQDKGPKIKHPGETAQRLHCKVCGGYMKVAKTGKEEWSLMCCDDDTCDMPLFSVCAGTQYDAIERAAIILGQVRK